MKGVVILAGSRSQTEKHPLLTISGNIDSRLLSISKLDYNSERFGGNKKSMNWN